MITTVEAIYRDGVLKLLSPIALPEGARVTVTIDVDEDRAIWLKASQECLMKTWDNDPDDVFNELRDR